MKVKFVDVDALVSRQSGVSAPGLEPQPALVLVLPHPHVLATLAGSVLQPGSSLAPTLVQWRLLVFVLNGHQSSSVNEVLSNVNVTPETGIVKGRVTMLVDKVEISLLSQQLK